jgi:uncharacterized protein YcbK (DUF882 family)
MRLRSRHVLRHARGLSIALAFALGARTGDAAPTSTPLRNARVVARPEPRPAGLPGEWAALLPAIEVKNRNTGARAKIRLYADDGGMDRSALRHFMRIACSSADAPDTPDGEVAEPLDPRLVQLAFRAAYHFKSPAIVVISATRRGSHGKHGTGDALDFQLEKVKAATLAAYARGYPRAGVGIYTHPRTQFVHVDVRERSYHWIDGSPPGVTWREKMLPDPTQQRRDASYVTAMDLPEAATR